MNHPGAMILCKGNITKLRSFQDRDFVRTRRLSWYVWYLGSAFRFIETTEDLARAEVDLARYGDGSSHTIDGKSSAFHQQVPVIVDAPRIKHQDDGGWCAVNTWANLCSVSAGDESLAAAVALGPNASLGSVIHSVNNPVKGGKRKRRRCRLPFRFQSFSTPRPKTVVELFQNREFQVARFVALSALGHVIGLDREKGQILDPDPQHSRPVRLTLHTLRLMGFGAIDKAYYSAQWPTPTTKRYKR